jgi:MtN3 and saliva related transmembrane protein
MPWTEVLGYVGAFLTSITFIPQVYKAWQTKSVGDLSEWMLAIVITSATVWLIYGIGSMLYPVIIANSIVLVLSLVLMGFKFSFRK